MGRFAYCATVVLCAIAAALSITVIAIESVNVFRDLTTP